MRPVQSPSRLTHLTAAAAWAAVTSRDARQDGRFVFGVATTGVYCRPSCGARRPLRQNVRFYDSPGLAIEAGFRACKRCKPDTIDESAALANRIRREIDDAGDSGVTLETLARKIGATPTRIQRTFKRATGMSPKEYQDARRGERLRKHLRSGRSVTRATIDAGYASTSRLHHRAGEVLGMTPNAFRHKGKGMQIEFGTASTPVGSLLVGYTDRGVCSVALGDDPRVLEAELREQFSAAEITPAGDRGKERIASVVGALTGDAAAPAVDLAGTEFQLLVWRALQRIPRGQTRSYSQIAASLGRPTATRAVARACAQNKVAVVVPCHRVIREDGGLGGYRWGLERKRSLLDREGATFKP